MPDHLLNMLINQNQKVTKKIQEQTGLSELTGYPRKVAESFVPVIICNEEEYSHIAEIATDTSAGTQAIYAIPAGYDFFLTGAHISGVLTDANEVVTSSINGTINGAVKTILKGQGKTSNIANTHGHFNTTLNLSHPLKLDSGTNITHVITESIGVLSVTAGILGYIKPHQVS